MLVLSRHKSEVIVIGEPGPEQIRIVVVEIRNGVVRLGCHADSDTPIHRLEVYEAIQRENERSAT